MKVATALCFCFLTNLLIAQTYSEITKVVASDRATDDYFGHNVAISGDYAIVGAYQDSEDANGNNTMIASGSAYIFKKADDGTNWIEIKKIVAADREQIDLFGFSVDISGDYAIIGAFHEDEDENGNNSILNAGSAYIFKKDAGGIDNWGQIKKITASDRLEQDEFGKSVAISDDYIIVGAAQNDSNMNGSDSLENAGSAYIFKKDEGGIDNWGQIKKITASDREPLDFFASIVDISPNYAIIGAFQEDENTMNLDSMKDAGSAYIFKKDEGGIDNWGQIKKIVATDRRKNDFFGRSISISGDYLIVGAHQEDHDTSGNNNKPEAGAAYIFKKDAGGIDNWGQIKKIVNSDRATTDFFGFSVGISGDYAVVGAQYEDEDTLDMNTMLNAGSAYIFKKDEGGIDNWGETQKIISSDRTAFDVFGYNVAISDYHIIIGAYQEDEDTSGLNTLSKAGAAYIFQSSAFIINSTNPQEIIDYQIYPNPVQNELIIQNLNGQFTLLNPLGIIVKQAIIKNSIIKVDLTDLPEGLYFISIHTNNGQIITQQIIKQY